jgi:hypothetical protein
MRSTLLFLHVLSAAAWLAAALWTPGDVRRTLALGRPAVDALAARARPALGLDLGAGLLTIVTGLAILGVDRVRPRTGVEIGLVASILRFLLMLLAMRPAWGRVEAAIAKGDLAEALPGAKRMAMLAGIAHLLWLVALAGLVYGA